MEIRQFEDKNLSHFSYAIVADGQVVLIDPARNIRQYLDFANQHKAKITGVIETHPHADFASGHLELHQLTGAPIYTSKDVKVFYPHEAFDEGQSISIGGVKLSAINTPGHSPDSISILLEHDGKQKAVFTGDTLFIGDCGRPDLREGAGNIQVSRNELATMMYHSLREKLATLDDDAIVYPAHGAGTLCGKNLSKESKSTIGAEKKTNWSLQPSSVETFVENLLADQPFVPAYFPYDVELNRKGALPMNDSIARVTMYDHIDDLDVLDKSLWIVDTRKESEFKNGHLPHSVNIMLEGKFETWLGSIIQPNEKFYLAAESKEQLNEAIMRAAAIGYETAIAAAFVCNGGQEKDPVLDVKQFRNNPGAYTIVDVRNRSEVNEKKIFQGSIAIPLAEVRGRMNEIPTDKPIVVHCAAGYRSATASSLLDAGLGEKTQVFDLGDTIKTF